MVAKTPPFVKEKRFAAVALNPSLLRETLEKVDRCVARLKEMQHTVSGGRKLVGTPTSSLSPRTIRGCQRTSTLRLKNSTIQKSPPGKFPANATVEWRRMSLPAMLLGETLLEVQSATQVAKRVATTAAMLDPKTPPVTRRTRPPFRQEVPELLHSRRAREKQLLRRAHHMERGSPSSLPRVRNRISFRPVSPPGGGGGEAYRHTVAAHRVSPRGSPWAVKKKKKTKMAVLFPNATFDSSPLPTPAGAAKRMTMIPGIKRSPPHKFLVKSPAGSSKFQVRVKSPPVVSLKKSPVSSRKLQGLVAPSTLKRSFSPSKLASRLVSPIKCRLSACRRRSSDPTADSTASGRSSTPAAEGRRLLPARRGQRVR